MLEILKKEKNDRHEVFQGLKIEEEKFSLYDCPSFNLSNKEEARLQGYVKLI